MALVVRSLAGLRGGRRRVLAHTHMVAHTQRIHALLQEPSSAVRIDMDNWMDSDSTLNWSVSFNLRGIGRGDCLREGQGRCKLHAPSRVGGPKKTSCSKFRPARISLEIATASKQAAIPGFEVGAC